MPIVYEGVNGAGRANLLFDGLKVWLAMRIPDRSGYVAKIQNNGGEIAKLERDADILIADHAIPKNAPSKWDSYSWKYIDAAIDLGELPDKEQYLIPRPGVASSSATVKAPGTGTRVLFSPEDDRIVTECARRQLGAVQGPGLRGSLGGNAFWVEFAEKHPRHTAQSWRDRWLNKLSLLPGNAKPLLPNPAPEKSDFEASPLPPVARGEKPSRTNQRQQGVGKQAAPQVRKRFTSEEDESIISFIRREQILGSEIGGNRIFEDFAREHPSHTAQSWRSRYRDILYPKVLEAESSRSEERETKASEPPAPQRASRSERPCAKHLVCQTDRQKSNRDDASLESEHRSPEDVQATDSNMDDAHRLSNEDSGDLLQDAEGDEDTSPSSDDEQRHPQEMNSVQKNTQYPARNDKTDDPREIFYTSYEDYHEFRGCEAGKVDLKPIIAGKRVDVFDLDQAVKTQNLPLDECDWAEVAAHVGLDGSKNAVVRKVSKWYLAHLKDFVSVLQLFEGHWEGYVDGSTDAESVDYDAGEEDTGCSGIWDPDTTTDDARRSKSHSVDDQLPVLPRLPSRESSKRPRSVDAATAMHSSDDGPRKRPRISRKIEIPGTPEEESTTDRIEPPTASSPLANTIQSKSLNAEATADRVDQSSTPKNAHITPIPFKLGAQSSSAHLSKVSAQKPPGHGISISIPIQSKQVTDSSTMKQDTSISPVLNPKAATTEIIKPSEKALGKRPERIERSVSPPAPGYRANGGISTKSAVKKLSKRTLPMQFGNRSLSKTPARSPEQSVTIGSAKASNGAQIPATATPVTKSPALAIPVDIMDTILSSATPKRTTSPATKSYLGSSATKSHTNAHATSTPKEAQRLSLGANSTPTSKANGLRVEDELDRWVSLGYERLFIQKLLHATSRDAVVMKKVLSMKSNEPGRGGAPMSGSIPQAMKGVWTEKDDQALRAVDEIDFEAKPRTADERMALLKATQQKRMLCNKHGFDAGLNARREYLRRVG